VKDVRPPRRVPFRVALLTLLVGLLVLTASAIVTVGAVTSNRSIRDLEERYFRATSTAVGGEVRPYLEPAVVTLGDTRDQALAGRVRLDDPDDLGRYLASRLRHLPTVAWLSYSDDETGRFVGAWRRDDGAIILNRSSPTVNGGKPVEVEIRDDGTTVPVDRGLPGGYDPRTGGWYRLAMGAEGVVWTEPFMFNEGRPGITSALALRDAPGAKPRGVLTADFFLDGLSRFLDALAGDDATVIDLMTRRGTAVAQSRGAHAHEAVLQAALAAAPQPPKALPVGEAQSWRFDHAGVGYAAGARTVRVAGGGEWVAAVAVPEERFLAGVEGNRRLAIGAAAAFLGLSLVLGWLLATRVARPLKRIAEDLERVSHFDLGGGASPTSRVKEIAVVIDSADRMKASLRSFARYVPTELVRDLLARGVEARLGGVHRRLTILFADAVGFTRISERMEPLRLAEHLGEFLDAVSREVRSRGGTIDKYMGDGVLAFFNAPLEVPGHAAAACQAALAAQARLAELAVAWDAKGIPPLSARIGIHTGDVIVGNLGTPERFAYTVIGDAVNLASRIETVNRRYGTLILASEEARTEAGGGFAWRTIDRVSVKGRVGATTLNELLGVEGEVPADVLRARDAYETALTLLVAQQFQEALDGFREAERARPGDLAAKVLSDRTERYLREPPPPDWNGTEALQEK
jgi:adenylate cyclase